MVRDQSRLSFAGLWQTKTDCLCWSFRLKVDPCQGIPPVGPEPNPLEDRPLEASSGLIAPCGLLTAWIY
jgi:hypothetical protein